jgi:hypothetical protein
MKRARALAITFALVPALGSLLVVLLLWVLAAFALENSEPLTASEKVELGLMIGLAGVAFLGAAFVIVFLALDRSRAATRAFLLHAAAALVLFVWAMSVSTSSDDAVLGFAVGCEVFGLMSIRIRPQRAGAT